LNKQDLDFTIMDLGERSITSPIDSSYYVNDEKKLLFHVFSSEGGDVPPEGTPALSFELAGPRRKLFFEPSTTKVAIVTCGGLCPGINDVIRAMVMELYYRYKVRNILGIRYGFQGLIPGYGHSYIELTPEVVSDIHTKGGSILSSSRGRQEIKDMVKTLKRMNVDILFCIGGDGSMRAAGLLTDEITKLGFNISIIGIPKTIDNDLNLVQKTFGFDTAIAEAVRAIQCAHVEAEGAPNGIGLVKIMGRQSGQLAAHAALAQRDVNIVLIPEVPFDLEGEAGLLATLEKRLASRGHCVILVAEGAGQELAPPGEQKKATDASGNPKLFDIGQYLKKVIEEHFQRINLDINLKYIDPSYILRSVPANASDRIYCGALGSYAVHAGMAGKTGMLVALMRDEYVHLPFRVLSSGTQLDPTGSIWSRVLESTGQPASIRKSSLPGQGNCRGESS
jgi:6-phosphofructokinase 1